MSRVYKPVQVEVTGSHRYGYGLAIPNPPKTCTRDTGLTGIMGIAELGDRVMDTTMMQLHHQPHCQTAGTTMKDETARRVRALLVVSWFQIQCDKEGMPLLVVSFSFQHDKEGQCPLLVILFFI